MCVLISKRILYKKMARKSGGERSLKYRKEECALAYECLDISSNFPSRENTALALTSCTSALLDLSASYKNNASEYTQILCNADYFSKLAMRVLKDNEELKISLLNTKSRVLYNLGRVKESMECLDESADIFWDIYRLNLKKKKKYDSYDELFLRIRFTAFNLNYGELAFKEKNNRLARRHLEKVYEIPDPQNYLRRRKKIALNLLMAMY